MNQIDDRQQGLLELLGAARRAETPAARRFVLLNGMRDVLPFHAAVLWQNGALQGHSGVASIDPLGPYGQWLARLVHACAGRPAAPIGAADVAPALAEDWDEWWPAHALWLPAGSRGDALLLVREVPWLDAEIAWLARWWDLWLLADRAAQAEGPRRVLDLPLAWKRLRGWRPWRSRGRRFWLPLALLVTVLLFPVRMTVRAPGELVPREPSVLRATVDGLARKLHVQPNQAVKAGELIAELDDAAAASKLQAARQALATAEAEWRQTLQQALSDSRAKAQLAVVQGRVEEKRTEVAYLGEQVRRTELRAPHDGVVLVDDPGAFAGRTIAAGEALVRVARPDDQEIEAWVAPGDAIDLPPGSPMQLFLASRPASPVRAQLRSFAYEPQLRPEGGIAYRVRGTLEGAARERLGARGTVHIDGRRVPLAYWVLRRPLAALRESTGW